MMASISRHLLLALTLVISACENRTAPQRLDQVVWSNKEKRENHASNPDLPQPSVARTIDSIALDSTGSSTLRRMATMLDRQIIPLGDTVLLLYNGMIDGREFRLEHYYRAAVLDSGFMDYTLYLYSRVLYGGREAIALRPDENNVLDPWHTGNEALVLTRDSTRIIVLEAGYMFCHGHGCSSISMIAIDDNSLDMRYAQFDTGICSEDSIWQFIIRRPPRGAFRIPASTKTCFDDAAVDHWINVEKMLEN
jgi:hypothetical protein